MSRNWDILTTVTYSKLLFKKCSIFEKLSFLKKCAKSDNKVVQYVYDCSGQKDLLNRASKLSIADLDVYNLSSQSHVVSAAVYDALVHSCH